MTSALSHLQPSNGNKISTSLLAGLLVLVLFSGCELFKPITTTPGGSGTTTNDPTTDRTEEPDELDPIQSRRVYDPETGTYIYVSNSPTQKMDTVRWRLISEFDAPPITEDGTEGFVPILPNDPTTSNPDGSSNAIEQTGTAGNGSRLLTAYNIDYVLPFLANRLTESDSDGGQPNIDENSEWALHFYSGAQMALDDLRSQNINLNVGAQDTRANANRVGQLQQTPTLRNAHMIIGPYIRNNVASIAERVRSQEQVLISPYSAATGISTNNPNYVQVNPTLETHCRNILEHAVNTQNADEIVLVAGPAQSSRFAIFQEAYKVLLNDVNVQPLTELIIEDSNTDLNDYLRARSVVFIVPIYADESFVANFLRQVYDATRDGYSRVAVYGLPQWKSFDRIDFDYYEGCNVHISSSVFVDPLKPEVREFRNDFFERFKVLPREEAFVGYDLTHYFARMMNQFGTRFQFELPRNPEALMHTEFRFEPMVLPQAGQTNFEQAAIDHWENTFVNILRFKNYQFRKVN